MKEEWRYIEGTNNLYQVSNCGRIRSFNLQGGGSRAEPYYLATTITPKGYCTSQGQINCNKIEFKHHREVAKAFIPNPENKPEVNHIDCDKTNNHVSNLEWCTHQENMNHAYENNLIPVLRGSKIGMSKLHENDVLQIRSIYEQKFATQVQIAKAYNVSQRTISLIVRNETWTHI